MWKKIVFISLIFMSCKKPYNPPIVASNTNYLVVEGVVNSGADSTIIKLSRTVNIAQSGSVAPELHAQLTVESDQNTTFPLQESGNGRYVSAGLNLDNSRKYRLDIKTADGKVYQSDFVAVVNSPAIDSVNYTVGVNGIDIFSNTHDPKNTTRYYRWDYQETWIIRSNFTSYFKSNGDTVLGRDLSTDDISFCWQNHSSSTIILGSSAKLSSDVISENPITSIGSTSERLGSKYSILVTQYALTPDAYNFWQNLKKNTEQLGSIFDAEPTQIAGNIHSVSNPTEPVIGYLSVGGTSSQRIFISSQQLPAWRPANPYPECKLDTFLYVFYPPGSQIAYNQVDEYINYAKGALYSPEIPVLAIGRPGSPPIGYTASTEVCTDCTLRGTNKKPAFWQ